MFIALKNIRVLVISKYHFRGGGRKILPNSFQQYSNKIGDQNKYIQGKKYGSNGPENAVSKMAYKTVGNA